MNRFVALLQAKRKDRGNFLQPSANDVKRYNWYLENAFDLEAIPKLPQEIIDNFRTKCGRAITFNESKDECLSKNIRHLCILQFIRARALIKGFSF